MKIQAEEPLCLGLALQRVFDCPMEVKEVWSLVGKPSGAAPVFGADVPTEGNKFL